MDLLIQIPEKPLMSDEEIICVPERMDMCCTINMVRNITPISGEETQLRQKTVLKDIADVKKSQVQKQMYKALFVGLNRNGGKQSIVCRRFLQHREN